MKQYLSIDPWKIIEDDFHHDYSKVSESIFSLGNGQFGQRGNFEEHYSGSTLKGNYFAGIYYPDKTRVGWWKNGYPEYFAKVLNAVDWASFDIYLGKTRLDLATCKPSNFRRVLDMKQGLLQRSFDLATPLGKIKCRFERFCSFDDKEVGVVQVSIESIDFDGPITISSSLDWNVVNEDANWDETFWTGEESECKESYARARATTLKTNFSVASAMTHTIEGPEHTLESIEQRDKYCSLTWRWQIASGQSIQLTKFTAHHSSFYEDRAAIYDNALTHAQDISKLGFSALKSQHVAAWSAKWDEADVIIHGDETAQQSIRYNIFQLLQTYTGEDPRLNIGPKGFTGEKYGGSTYWDTEAYCIPFYLGSGDPLVPRQLLVYRYKHLTKAIENAGKLGFNSGAALYPMVTMNGEECHNEWEITFEEIHRNGAIAYAIFDYIRYTGDDKYLDEGGLDVLVGIARFWSQRVHMSQPKQQYVMLGVTGPNEYDNNVDNNWYTNKMAQWCLRYAADCAASHQDHFERLGLDTSELERWREIADNMYLPEDKDLGIFLQQDNYMEKEQLTVDQIPQDQRPINQNWSWDRILRSCFIKQADVLQGLYFFEDEYSKDVIKRNFDFYEPRTVHESSLSPCIHSILASKLGYNDKAYEMYLRTARLDLEDYNNDTDEGLHITSMAGTWMAIVKGFAGLTIKGDKIVLAPNLPEQWTAIEFQIRFRDNNFRFHISHDEVVIHNLSGGDAQVVIDETPVSTAKSSMASAVLN